MRKVFLWMFCFSFLVGGSYALGRAWSERGKVFSAEVDNGFLPVSFPLEQRSFVIFISGYNNGAFVEKALRSVFAQAYEAYRVIYVDDASTDGSFEAANDAIYLSGEMLRVTAVQNEARLGQLANLVRAAEACRDDEILVVVNGEDWLAHEWVLSTLNKYYADPDLWMTYGQYCEFPLYKKGTARRYLRDEWEKLREAPLAAGHLKTFYAGLFRKVSTEHLMQHDAFFPAAFDLAVMLPMLEMAKDHFQFIPDILYVANRHAPMQVDPEMQARCENIIRSFKPYAPLDSFSIAEGQ